MNSFDDISNRFAKLSEEIKAKQEQLAKEARSSMQPAFNEYFSLYPKVKAIVWAQYTPYFNDGDECIFRVCEFDLYFDDEDYSVQHGETIFSLKPPRSEYWAKYETNPASWEADVVRTYQKRVLELGSEDEVKRYLESSKLLEKIFSLPKDIMQQIYGNHVQVIATPNNTVVEEYDHE